MSGTYAIYVLLQCDSLYTILTQVKPIGDVVTQYFCKSLGTQFIFMYGRLFNPQCFFIAKTEKLKIEVPYIFPVDKRVFNVTRSLLKSGLQKCVRRQEVDLALRIAKCFIRTDCKAFVKRLLVISAEDVFLDIKCANTLLWMYFVLDKKKDMLSKRQIEWLLGYVKALCEETKFVHFEQNEDNLSLYTKFEFSLLRMYINTVNITLEGDKRMLTFIHNHATVCSMESFSAVDIDSIQEIERKDIPLYAVDFHTHPWILKSVSEKTGLKEQEIKTLMWKCRSGVNNRKVVMATKEVMIQYEQIAPQIDYICRKVLFD